MNARVLRTQFGVWGKGISLFFVPLFAVVVVARGQSGADQVLSAVYDKSSKSIRVSSASGGGGTVTSVGLSMPGEFSVSGSPVTNTGTLSVLWAQPLSIAHGGTGQSTAAGAFNTLAPPTAAGGLIYGTGINTYGNLSLGSSGQCLQSSGTTLVWGACGSGSSGIFQVNGTGLLSSTTVNFENSAATNGLTLNFSNPTAGNVQLGLSGILSVAGGGTGTASPALAAGSNISITGAWPNNTISLSGTVPVANGGTGLMGVGSSGQCLTSNGSAVVWGSCGSASVFTAGGDLSGTSANQTVVGLEGRPLSPVTPTAGQIIQWNGTTWIPATLSGTGTVTSIGLSLPSIFTVVGSPVTAAGTLTGTLNTQSANLVFAGPSSGAAAAPAFRALVGADLPVPSATTLGGTESAAAVAHEWINSISTAGVPALSQPTFSDLSGAATLAQLPAIAFSDLTGTASDAQLANAYSGVGVCAAGQFISSLARNAAPTCATPAGGASGTVTSFSAGALSPLFTTTVATATTTPALSFTLSNAAADSWFGNAAGSSGVPAFNTSALPVSLIPNPAGDVTGTFGATTVTGLHFGTNGYTLGTAALTSGQCIGYNGTNILGVTCGSGGGFTAGGDLSGTSTSQNVIGFDFGGTNLTLGTVPTSGQCLEYNGTSITGAACAGGSGNLPASWSTGNANTSLFGEPAASTDATTLNLTPSEATGGTYNIFQVGSNGTAATTSCSAGVYFAVEYNGNLCFTANNLQLGANNQPTASALTLFGGVGAGPYIDQESAALTPPVDPVPVIQTGGTLPNTQTFNFEWVYETGPGTPYTTTVNPGGFKRTTPTVDGTSEISIALPSPWEPGAVKLALYGYETSNGTSLYCGTYTYATNAWSGAGCGTIAVSGTNLIVSTWANTTTGSPVSVNNSGGINFTYFSAAEQASGAACFSISVPMQDCPLANALYMSGGGGLNLEIPAGANGIAAGNVVAYSATAGIVPGDYANQVTIAPASSANFIGVAANVGQTIYVQTSGLATVTLDGTYTTVAGDFACMSTTTTGDVTQSSAACPAGEQVGIIAQAGTGLTSVLVQLTSAQGVGGGGGSSTAFQANGAALSSSATVNFEGSGSIAITNPSAGNVQFGCATCVVTNPSATQTITAGSASVEPLILNGVNGQTADIFDVKLSGTPVFEIGSGGYITVPSGYTPSFNGGFIVNNGLTVSGDGATTLSGVASLAIAGTGNFGLNGSAGQHINSISHTGATGCAASTSCTDTEGVLAISAATSVTYTFTTNYTSAPVCVASPTSNPGTTTWWVTTVSGSPSTITINLSASSTLNFNYICRGNPN